MDVIEYIKAVKKNYDDSPVYNTTKYLNPETRIQELATGGRIGFASGTPFAITDSNLAKIHTLIQNTDLSLKEIGKKIGFGTDKKPMDSTSKVFRKYVKKYGEPDKIRLQTRGVKLTKDSPYVKNVIKSVEEVGVRETARRFGKERKTIRNVLHRFRKDLIKDINVKGKETSATKSKIKAKENIKIAETKAGPKTTKQTKDVISKIAEYNEPYKKMSAKNLAKDKNFLKRLRMHIDINTGEVTYDGYTKARPVRGKVFTDLELADHAIKKANQGQLFTHDHIKPKKLQKQDIGYPRNLQPATYIENSNFNNARDYVLNNPKGDTSAIDKYLTKNKQTLRFPDQKIKLGYKEVIEYNPAKGTHTLIDKPVKPSRGGVTLGSNFANVTPEMLDFRKLPGDVRHFADIAVKSGAKSPALLNALKKAKAAGKWTGVGLAGEAAFALPFAEYGYRRGESTGRLWGDATLGLLGETAEEEIIKATGERGYATQQIDEYGSQLEGIMSAYNALNDENDPRGEQRQMFENLYKSTRNKYNTAYNMFVDDTGQFNKDLYNRALNNYTAGIVQIDKFKKQKQAERAETAKGYGAEREIRNLRGYASGGIANLTRTTPPERGPQYRGLDYLRKHGRGY